MTLRGALFAAMVAAGSLAAPAAATAQQAAAKFDIAPGPLAQALAQFGRQAGMQVTYIPSLAAGRVSLGISGTIATDNALAGLLAGTGLVYRYAGANTVTITDPNADAVVYDGSIVLETIDVTAWVQSAAAGSGFQGTPDWIYEAPESVSVVSRQAIQNMQVRDARDLMSGVAGVYSGEGNGSFPTVSPNIRGLQDSGRIVVSIDGAQQNAQRGLGNSSGGYQSSGQAYVDRAFIVAVEVDKNPGASSGEAGSLGGSVNFRTIGADDLIADGNSYGLEIDLTRGTNEYNRQDSILGAARLGDTPFSITAGISGLDLGEYKAGMNGTTAAGGSFKGRQNWSSLLKLEGDFEDSRASLSWMHQESAFKYQTNAFSNFETLVNDSLAGQINWTPTDNELIDLQARLWLNNMRNTEVREERNLGGGVISAPETTINLGTLSFGGSLENTSRMETAAGPLTLNYGVEAFRDTATSSASSTSITANPSWESRYTAFGPAGARTVASAFINGELEPADWVTLSGGLRYDWYRLQGSPTYYNLQPAVRRFAAAVETEYAWRDSRGENPAAAPPFLRALWLSRVGEGYGNTFYLAGAEIIALSTPAFYRPNELIIDRVDGALLPSVTAEFEPVEWFKPYISYSHSARPPTILEAFFSGGAPGDGTPGINYAPNPSLRSEQARTWEVGANISLDGVLLENDSLRVKLAAFNREIDDYIVMGDVVAPKVTTQSYLGFVNVEGITTMRGVEVEGNYDARHFWFGGSATWLETDWPQSTEILSNGTLTSTGVIAATGIVPPRFKLTLDGGVRLFEEKLQVGARVTHVTPTLSRNLTPDGELQAVTEAYTTLDLYGSYQVNENVGLRLAINNVTDLRYVPASGGYTAPGRTVLGSLNVKF